MLDDPRAAAMVTNFAGQWLHLRELADAAKETTLYPAWKDEYLPLFRRRPRRSSTAGLEGRRQAGHAAVRPLHRWSTAPLAGFYGIKGITGDSFQKVDLDAGQRAGMLTQASLLAAKSGPDQSSPILRGVFVREQMFCQPLPQPPTTVDANPPELNPAMTTKERFAAHRKDPSCEGCHDLIDPIGFGFENVRRHGRLPHDGERQAGGRHRRADRHRRGRSSSTARWSWRKKLVQSKEVEACVASHWFNFALGREPSDADACTTHSLKAAFASSGGDLRQLLLATVQTDAFLFKGGSR